MAGRAVLRAGVAALAVVELAIGAWELLAPRSFYSSFPAGRDWVQALGPYDSHLMTDVGELTLALGVLLALAAVWFERRLVQAALIAYLVYAVPHLVFHAIHRDHLSAADNAGNLATLGLAVLVPAVLLWLSRR